jgi:hypothetical protein
MSVQIKKDYQNSEKLFYEIIKSDKIFLFLLITLLSFFKLVILCKPLSVRQVDITLIFRVLTDHLKCLGKK